MLTFLNDECDAMTLMFDVTCYFLLDTTIITTDASELELSVQMQILNSCMLIQLLLSVLHNDAKRQQH